MKDGKVMDLLQISRSTLKRYHEKGILEATKLPTGQYIFDDDSVFFLLKNKHSSRMTVLYGRVSTHKQKADLANQMQELADFAESKGFKVDASFQDIASGISFEKRREFFKMLDLILEGKVKRVIIAHQYRLSRVGFDLFEYLFKNYGTEIDVISDEMNPKTDEQELLEEITALLSSFSKKS